MRLVKDDKGKVSLEVKQVIDLGNPIDISQACTRFPEARGLIMWGIRLFKNPVPAVIDRNEKGIRYQTQSWIDLDNDNDN